MIEVEHFSKTYAGFKAVRDISFRVDKGEIVGFLGPNGAGKSTTMKVLAGYLPPTDGHIRVAGYDVVTESLEVRRRVGYMPENVPLYTDMRVDEFLRFRARLKGVPGRQVRDRVEHVKRLCHLQDAQHKIIGTLSKGFRQRVGLADAIVHNPDLLILDEPTIGLDPHQIRSVRDLIRELGQHHTILLSTHILSEVEATCSRVLILNRGKIEASDTPANLTRLVRGGAAVVVEVRASREDALQHFSQARDVEEVEVIEEQEGGWLAVKAFPKAGADVREALYDVIRHRGWSLREMRRSKASLEEIFVELTQD
ncbi:MAG: ATP-binding cassette domain-containing protein [Verrucomicrobium sp.]|nr:ATP-binding cassette domain-containing protein [Verrucomicrobium sp.]